MSTETQSNLPTSKITQFLSASNPIWLIVYVSCAAFLTYTCMYAFRKPFSVATYENVTGWEGLIDFKIAIILSQVFGYLFSKFIGIKVVSEMTASKRAWAILALVMASEVALICFAITPAPYNVAFMFLNGLPLGMIWGLVFSFLEGRKSTEILGAVLCVTFIVASGWVRTVGKWLLLETNVSEVWMPAVTGAIFTLPFFVCLFFLSKTPLPSKEDVEMRCERKPMDGKARLAFFLRFAPGILFLISAFLLFTGLRDFRDNFSAEIWSALGHGEEPGIFAYAGIRMAFFVLLALALMVKIKDNVKAFFANQYFVLFGCALMGCACLLFEAGSIDGKTWMVALGAGLYIAYIPFNCFLFDRLVSSVGSTANAGFLIYLADSAGYVGSVSILLYRTFASPDISWLSFFIGLCYLVSILGAAFVLCSLVYFRRLRHASGNAPATPA